MSEFEAAVATIRRAVAGLISADHLRDASFVHLPFVYPGGTAVTVRIDPLSRGRFRISDDGFGYREIEQIGAERSFTRTAASMAEEFGVEYDSQVLFLIVDSTQIESGISEVGAASFRLVDKIFSRYKEEDGDDLIQKMSDRLLSIFGKEYVQFDASLSGASTASWELTAVVRQRRSLIVFQAIGAHANSIYRTNAAFDDLAALEDGPALVGVVSKKEELGARLQLLSRTASVIEASQIDEVYISAARGWSDISRTAY